MQLLVSFRRPGCSRSGPWDLPALILLIDFKTISGDITGSSSGSIKQNRTEQNSFSFGPRMHHVHFFSPAL